MKRRFCAMLFLALLLYTHCALAAKARSIASEADSAFHAQHLAGHIGAIDCVATGNYIKVRTEPGGNKLVGHLEQADAFDLVDVRDGWALIRVTASAPTSPDSRADMTGWVDADYIDCACSDDEYASNSVSPARPAIDGVLPPDQWQSYEDVLDAYYYVATAISPESYEDFNDYIRDVEHILGEAASEWAYYPTLSSGYIIRDLNQDGVDELVILYPEDTEGAQIISLYTMENQRPKLLLYGWTRNNYYLTKDGGIANYGSNGASYPIYYVFDIVGTSLKVRGGLIGDITEAGEPLTYYTTDTDYDTSNDVLLDGNDAWDTPFAEEDHCPAGVVTFAEYGESRSK